MHDPEHQHRPHRHQQHGPPEPPLPVLVPCAAKDQALLPLVLQRLRRFGQGLGRIVVVSSKPPAFFPEGIEPFEWIHDDALPLTQRDLQHWLGADAAAGWWWQQLLKLQLLRWRPDLGQRILVWDSESVLMRPLHFEEAGRILLHPASEIHAPYTAHFSTLVPALQRWHPRVSGITHWMVFDAEVLDDLIGRVQSHWHMPFWQAYLAAVQPQWRQQGGASEYDLMFNYALAYHSDRYQLRSLKWRVTGDLNALRASSAAPRDQRSTEAYLTCHRHLRDRFAEVAYYQCWTSRLEGKLPEGIAEASSSGS